MVGEVTGTGAVVSTDTGRFAPAIEVSAPGGSAVPAPRAIPVSGESVALSSPKVHRYADRLDQLETSNQAALAIRSADAAMAGIGDSLEKMKQALTRIVKQYPPFALESRERVEYLNNFAGLRKQVEALTRMAGADSAINVSFPGGEQFAIRIGQFASAGADIPVLGSRAGDDEVAAALDRVAAAAQVIARERSALAGAVRSAVSVPDASIGNLLHGAR
jgi:hypothetical protein